MFETLREIWNMHERTTLVETTEGRRYELVGCRNKAVLFDQYGQPAIRDADHGQWRSLRGQFPRVVEEVRTLPLGS